MDERATGILLHKRRLTETSLIIRWLTLELGIIDTVAKGALRPKSPYRGKLDVFFRCDISFARSRRSDLHTLREVALRHGSPALRRGLHSLQQASYAATLLQQTAERETPIPGLYELLLGFLDHLEQQPPSPISLMSFEIKMLEDLGLCPDLTNIGLSPGTRRALEYLIQNDWGKLVGFPSIESQVAELQKFLHAFIIFHLGRIPSGRTAALNGE